MNHLYYALIFVALIPLSISLPPPSNGNSSSSNSTIIDVPGVNQTNDTHPSTYNGAGYNITHSPPMTECTHSYLLGTFCAV